MQVIGLKCRGAGVRRNEILRTTCFNFLIWLFMSTWNPPLMSGPIAPENNPPIEPQFFQPRIFEISAISNGTFTTITTTIDHDYVVGQNVRFLIPMIYGERQLNEQTSIIISLPSSNQFVVALDSSSFDLFTANPTSGTTQPQVIAIGDVNTGIINSSGRTSQGTFIPGSFENIS